MAATTTPNARLIEVDFEGAVCRPTDEEGWPADECGEPAKYVAFHTPAGTSPAPTIYGSHDALCQQHAREMVARCLKWTCRGAN